MAVACENCVATAVGQSSCLVQSMPGEQQLRSSRSQAHVLLSPLQKLPQVQQLDQEHCGCLTALCQSHDAPLLSQTHCASATVRLSSHACVTATPAAILLLWFDCTAPVTWCSFSLPNMLRSDNSSVVITRLRCRPHQLQFCFCGSNCTMPVTQCSSSLPSTAPA